jgi:hypothetical protein
MSVSIKLGTDVVWGITSAEGGVLTAQGKLLSVTRKSTAKQFEQEGEQGEVYSVVFYDQREEVTVEVLCKTTAVIPAPGSTLTVAGVTDLLVSDAEVKWQAGGTKKLSISAWKSVA